MCTKVYKEGEITVIALSDFIASLSVALDYVEKELLGIADFHSQRIAYISYQMGKLFDFTTAQCVAVAEAAILHDNALKEFIEDETVLNENGEAVPKHDEQFMSKHCIAGEKNVEMLPVYPMIQGAVLYHHECADGSGAFGKTAPETPLTARLIHIADIVDATWNLSSITEEKLEKIRSWVQEKEGSFFDKECVDAFLRVCTYAELSKLTGSKCIALARETIRTAPENISIKALLPFADIFAKITDYKSRFTCTHSQGIADKARALSAYYGWDEDTQDKMYTAGALHDIGKLAVNNDILEKPGKLTSDEYETMREHAQMSFEMLSSIRGFDEIARWASMHHEKLDGSGYPFGKTAKDLGQNERIVACLDVYQALREERPYKAGMSHSDAMAVLREMSEQNQLDAGIVEDINRCFA